MPAPTIDFNLPDEQITANINEWLIFLADFFNQNPTVFIFHPEEHPFLKQQIVRGASAKDHANVEYFILLEEIGNGAGAYGAVYRVPFVLKRQANGTLTFSDRRIKAYQYALKDIFVSPENQESGFAGVVEAVKKECYYAGLFLRTQGNKPVRPVIIFSKAQHVMYLMALAPGMRLSAAFIQKNWPHRSYANKFNILWQLTEILRNFQDKKKVHMDIKIDNLILSEKDELRCVDYGNMVATDEMVRAPRGTCGYLAPEMMGTMGLAKPETDIFAALAVFLYIHGAENCFAQKKYNDAKLTYLNQTIGAEAIFHQYHLMAYDKKGLLQGKFQLNKSLTKSILAMLEQMEEFNLPQRADATWVEARMREIFVLAVAAHRAEIMRLKSIEPQLQLDNHITQLFELQKEECKTESVQHYSQLVESAKVVVDQFLEDLEKKVPKQSAIISLFFESKEQKHLSALKNARQNMLWPKLDAIKEVAAQPLGASENNDDDNDALTTVWTFVEPPDPNTPTVSF